MQILKIRDKTVTEKDVFTLSKQIMNTCELYGKNSQMSSSSKILPHPYSAPATSWS